MKNGQNRPHLFRLLKWPTISTLDSYLAGLFIYFFSGPQRSPPFSYYYGWLWLETGMKIDLVAKRCVDFWWEVLEKLFLKPQLTFQDGVGVPKRSIASLSTTICYTPSLSYSRLVYKRDSGKKKGGGAGPKHPKVSTTTTGHWQQLQSSVDPPCRAPFTVRRDVLNNVWLLVIYLWWSLEFEFHCQVISFEDFRINEKFPNIVKPFLFQN